MNLETTIGTIYLVGFFGASVAMTVLYVGLT